MISSPSKALPLFFAVALGLTSTGEADAVGTRQFVLDTLSSFEGGELKGVSIASDGSVRAGWNTAETPITDATSVWSSVALKDGSVLLGTGSGGRIYRVRNGKATIYAETGEMAVSALTLTTDGHVIAGTFPEAKLFRLDTRKAEHGKVKPWLKLKDAEDVWSLAYDSKSKAVFAATGPEGKLYRVDGAAKADVYFDSEESHLVSVAISPGGVPYTGSNGKALLFRVPAAGRAEVVHDFEGDDVKAIAFDAKGNTYAIANKYSGSSGGLRPGKISLTGSTSAPKKARPGKGELMRFSKSGIGELLYKDKKSHFVSLTLDEAGVPFVGTGAEGKVYSVDADHVRELVIDTEQRQIGTLVVAGANRYLATTDPVVFHRIKGTGGQDAVWTSKVLDAGLRAHFGKLEWTAAGSLELQTRSGNTSEPGKTWSAWSAALNMPGKVASPGARHLQIRARWSKDSAAVLREVSVSFVTDNARTVITEITAGSKRSYTGGSSVPKSGGKPKGPETKLKLKWKVLNPDSDKMRYRLHYRPVGSKAWFSMLEPNEEITSTSYSWDTSGLPEGRYRVRVDASDELSNPPQRTMHHAKISQTVVVDNTAPQLTALTLTGGRLRGTASDQVGPIARIELALVGKKTWWPLFPSDSIFDSPSESFDVDVSKLIPPGPHLVVVRAYDTAGNKVERTVARGR